MKAIDELKERIIVTEGYHKPSGAPYCDNDMAVMRGLIKLLEKQVKLPLLSEEYLKEIAASIDKIRNLGRETIKPEKPEEKQGTSGLEDHEGLLYRHLGREDHAMLDAQYVVVSKKDWEQARAIIADTAEEAAKLKRNNERMREELKDLMFGEKTAETEEEASPKTLRVQQLEQENKGLLEQIEMLARYFREEEPEVGKFGDGIGATTVETAISMMREGERELRKRAKKDAEEERKRIPIVRLSSPEKILEDAGWRNVVVINLASYCHLLEKAGIQKKDQTFSQWLFGVDPGTPSGDVGVTITVNRETLKKTKTYSDWKVTVTASPIEPPLEVKSKQLWQEERLDELCNAIGRYFDGGKKVPVEWHQEIADLGNVLKVGE